MPPPPAARVLLVLCSALGILVLVLWLLYPTPPAPPPPKISVMPPRMPHLLLPAGTDPESVALRGALINGERIYQQLCFHCHGRQGKGDNNEYMASIGHKPADHTDLASMQRLSDDEFFAILRDGVKDQRGWFTMPPWASVLTPTEMRDVITYVRHLARSDEPRP